MKAIIWDFSGTLYNKKEDKLFEGAKEILVKCSKKYKQAIVTTKLSDPEGRIQLMKNLGIWKYFNIVEISLKTEGLFLDICKRFNCKPEKVYVIGDGYKFGPAWSPYPREIFTGEKLGMKTIWCDFHKTPKLKQLILGIKYWKKISSLKDLENVIDL
ncbi:HAD family hydrolase [Candidatus Dojkabacteria bacterium]|nr:HAD family hydrolase [Candidatus Dojkabacteria bacterium]